MYKVKSVRFVDILSWSRHLKNLHWNLGVLYLVKLACIAKCSTGSVQSVWQYNWCYSWTRRNFCSYHPDTVTCSPCHSFAIGTHRWNLLVPHLQINYCYFISRLGPMIIMTIKATGVTYPLFAFIGLWIILLWSIVLVSSYATGNSILRFLYITGVRYTGIPCQNMLHTSCSYMQT